ncbi:bombyxin B-2-like [Ptychodera flava]|uniref:bombyxin B-2-like n=1 Tax=Ptychodera flava TaxID=63121 RepID=UPI00396A9388
MNSLASFLVLTTIALLCVSSCRAFLFNHRSCGTRLAETLSQICRGCYAHDDRPGISRREASSFLTTLRPQRAVARGSEERPNIVEECCRRYCTLSRRIQYCCYEVQLEYQIYYESRNEE